MSPASPLPRPRGPLVDVVVIGAGVMGAATAWQLARSGRQVVLIDRFAAGHTCGASHGASRIYRQAYGSARYLRLAAEALPLWRELEAETAPRCSRSPAGSITATRPPWPRSRATLAAHDVRHEWLDPDRAALLWPGMRFAGPVLHQPDRAGRIARRPGRGRLHRRGARARRRGRRPLTVTGIEVRGDDLVGVRTADGVLGARRVVVTAGAWTARAARRDRRAPAAAGHPGAARLLPLPRAAAVRRPR